MNYAAYVNTVSQQLAGLGFAPAPVPADLEPRLSLAVSRKEPWGLLLLALPSGLNLEAQEEREALVRDCAAWVRDRRGEESWQLILLFPFDRPVTEEEAAAVASLREQDPEGRWGVLPWSADLDVGLLDQHKGFPPVDPEIARILTEVPEPPAAPAAQWARGQGPVQVRRWIAPHDFPATRVILALTSAYYLWTVLQGGGLPALVDGPDAQALVLWGANFSVLTLLERTQQWRLLSHLFLHGNAMHLAFNMWALWQVGRYIEAVYGSGRMLFIYMVAGVAGGAASAALRPSWVLSVGASGAILGLMGALVYFATTVRHRRVDWYGILMPVAINLLFGLVYARVDNYAHFGGFLGGLAAAFVAGVPGERGGWRRIAMPAVLVLALLLVAGVIPLRHISLLFP